nr:MAG TPA: hypothetical protein [Caudoviricetes sp.]
MSQDIKSHEKTGISTPPPPYNALNASVLGEKISARKGYVYVR